MCRGPKLRHTALLDVYAHKNNGLFDRTAELYTFCWPEVPVSHCKALYDCCMGPNEEEDCLKKGILVNVYPDELPTNLIYWATWGLQMFLHHVHVFSSRQHRCGKHGPLVWIGIEYIKRWQLADTLNPPLIQRCDRRSLPNINRTVAIPRNLKVFLVNKRVLLGVLLLITFRNVNAGLLSTNQCRCTQPTFIIQVSVSKIFL